MGAPNPLLIAALLAGLGYNIAELLLSAPYQTASVPIQKQRTVRRAVARVERTSQPTMPENTVVDLSRRSFSADRGSLSKRLGAIGEEEQLPQPVPTPTGELHFESQSADESLVDVVAAIDAALAELDLRSGSSTSSDDNNFIERSEVEQTLARIEESDLLPGSEDAMDEVRHLAQGQENAGSQPNAHGSKDVGQVTHLARTIREVDESPHSEHSALAVDIVDVEIETMEPVADVAALEQVIEAVEAEGEADATMDALVELGSSMLGGSEPIARTEDTQPAASDDAVAEAMGLLEVAQEAPEAVIEIPAALPVATATTPAAPPPINVVAALGADLMGDAEPQARPIAGLDPAAEASASVQPAPNEGTDSTQAQTSPAKDTGPTTVHLRGRVKDPVDIVIAQLQVNPLRPQATAARRRAGLSTPSIPVPSRVATGLRASSETLAMLRNQLGVGQPVEPARKGSGQLELPREPAAAALPRSTSASDSGAGESQIDSSETDTLVSKVALPELAVEHARIDSEPATRAPERSPQVADNTRDKVMFVWHERHFPAPLEGRHPLRVAQSLYDFMVEETMERSQLFARQPVSIDGCSHLMVKDVRGISALFAGSSRRWRCDPPRWVRC
ncbi:MAG: hypothetical protein FJ194_12015 [Gammaproteobacteria bacterium]|nr:hypothetical protein [Gammaproteobacteria bacterium]